MPRYLPKLNIMFVHFKWKIICRSVKINGIRICSQYRHGVRLLTNYLRTCVRGRGYYTHDWWCCYWQTLLFNLFTCVKRDYWVDFWLSMFVHWFVCCETQPRFKLSYGKVVVVLLCQKMSSWLDGVNAGFSDDCL